MLPWATLPHPCAWCQCAINQQRELAPDANSLPVVMDAVLGSRGAEPVSRDDMLTPTRDAMLDVVDMEVVVDDTDPRRTRPTVPAPSTGSIWWAHDATQQQVA